MALASPRSRPAAKGRPKPRVAPPTPARTAVREYEDQATAIGIDLMPWQRTAARYLTALGRDERWLYREVAAIVARQNGKTRLLVPLIVRRLRDGRRIMHTAQNRELPREVFGEVADVMQDHYAAELRSKPRFANGQEEIRLRNGGTYRIVAPTRGGARGPSNDDVIVDELREMESFDFIAAAKPTLTASRKPQMIYLSNAGTEDSAVLNALKSRAGTDPDLAYLEWSAAPERTADDRGGWVEANPAVGHETGDMGSVLATLESAYRTAMLEGTLAIFETEHLCRWVVTMRERLVDEFEWNGCAGRLGKPSRPFLGISMDPSGTRASAVLAWAHGNSIAVRHILEGTGDPINTDALGRDLRSAAVKHGVRSVGYDPLTDAELAKYFPKSEALTGRNFANATATFVTAVKGKHLVWDDAGAITDDLTWTARKPHDESGSYQAVRAKDDRPITAVLAAVRAVWLASGPKPSAPKGF